MEKDKKVELYQPAVPWRRRWWAIVLFVFLGLVLFFSPFYIYQFYQIYQQAKAGSYISETIFSEDPPYDMNELVDSLSPSWGADSAPITIVEFGDFNCPLCRKAFPAVRSMMEKHGDKVKFYWRHYPAIGENSVSLAKAAICAHKQAKFWPFHDLLFQRQGENVGQDANALAKAVGLDLKIFNECLENKLTLAQIKKDYYAAEDGEVRGTPTFFINGYKIEAAVPAETWDQIIEKFFAIYEKNIGN